MSIYWIKDTFIPYCKKQGYNLIRDDLNFIENTLKVLPVYKRRPVLFEYCKIWQRAMDSEDDANKKQSAGRRAANLYLLKYSGGKKNES